MEGSIETNVLTHNESKEFGAKIGSLLSFALAPILSGALLVLAFPRHDISWLVWVGLVPLILALSHRSNKYGFFAAYVCGITYLAWVFSWAFEIPGYRLSHHIILALYVGCYFGFFGLAYAVICRNAGITTALIIAPFIWVSLEYVRCNMSFLALPWPLLAHSQYQHLPIIQVASLTGAYGTSFLIVFVNCAIAALIYPLMLRVKNSGLAGHHTIPTRGQLLVAGSALVLVSIALLYGYVTLARPITGKKIKISVVQGNIDEEKKQNPRKHAKFIMQRYSELTHKAAQDKADIIAWPEAATPGFVLKSSGLLKQMRSLIREHGTHFIIGSSEYSKFAKAASDRGKIGNTALFFSPKGKVLGQYLKIRLIPFGEYVPYEETFPWPRFIVPEGKRSFEVPGKDYTLFEIDGEKFGATICWESHFPGLFREFVKKGATFMVNLTNEGWFGDSAAPYQKMVTCVFRAVENRVSIARAANTGISCFINPNGEITGRVWKNNKDIFVEGYLTQEISISEEKAFYTMYGDVFAYLSILITVVALALSFRKAEK